MVYEAAPTRRPPPQPCAHIQLNPAAAHTLFLRPPPAAPRPPLAPAALQTTFKGRFQVQIGAGSVFCHCARACVEGGAMRWRLNVLHVGVPWRTIQKSPLGQGTSLLGVVPDGRGEVVRWPALPACTWGVAMTHTRACAWMLGMRSLVAMRRGRQAPCAQGLVTAVDAVEPTGPPLVALPLLAGC